MWERVSGQRLLPLQVRSPDGANVPHFSFYDHLGLLAREGGGRVHYYESEDLKRFAEVGKFRKDLMDQFFAYYNEVTGKDGALTRREKALIALAVAHSRQCPYCIDAYTVQCLESGASPDQMTEAVHVAAAMEAGMTLVHGVQMHNVLERHGG
jgi:alkylhydroperoxidase/carboxymuconolactone decarboxylase family protein